MTHEEAEDAVLKVLVKTAERLGNDRNPKVREWGQQWCYRFHLCQARGQFMRERREQRGHRPADLYHLNCSERFIDLAEAFGISLQGLAETLCDAFVRANPRRIVMDRRTTSQDVEEMCLATIPALCCG